EVVEHRKAALKGARVVLVDDVYTSGATIEALSDELRAQGVAHIGVVVVARVVRHTHLQPEFELE
ncbi:MAG: ComF family protein, partial [Alphaproteobacteria bacterium]